MLMRRHPFAKDTTASRIPEEAAFFEMEKQSTEVPPELTFDALAPDISPVHRARLKKIWSAVGIARNSWQKSARMLEAQWEAAPPLENKEVQKIIDSVRVKIPENLQKAIAAGITVVGDNADADGSALELWQSQEKGLRREYYENEKTFFVALRLYYEMLLESSPSIRDKKVEESARPYVDGIPDDKKDPNTVLPLNHPRRKQIVIANRYLRVSDATHQGISLAKAMHHEQGKGRLRKTEAVPYVYHPQEVAFMYSCDVVPFITEETSLKLNPAMGVAIAALHDVGEDTVLSVEALLSKVLAVMDRSDTRLDPVIESGFGKDIINLKENVLGLLSHPKTKKHFIHILKALSHTTVLNDQQKKRAFCENITGVKTMRKLFGLEKQSLKQKWGIDTTTEKLTKPSSSTFTLYPHSEDEKLDLFLVRASLLTGEERQHALIVKCLDRSHNLSTIDGKAPEKQQKILRGTVTRLIAYAMLDCDAEKYPLYNALPRLIDTTMNEYNRFAQKYGDLMEPADREYIEQLVAWEKEVKRFALPESIMTTMKGFRERVSEVVSEPEVIRPPRRRSPRS